MFSMQAVIYFVKKHCAYAVTIKVKTKRTNPPFAIKSKSLIRHNCSFYDKLVQSKSVLKIKQNYMLGFK